MIKNEISRLMGLLAVAQGQEPEREDFEFWLDALQDLDGDLAFDALRRIARENVDKFITPAMVRRMCQQIASERLAAATKAPLKKDEKVSIDPPAGLSDAEYLQWLRTWREAISTGRSPQEAEVAALSAVGRGEIEPRDRPAPDFSLPSATAQGEAIEGEIVQHWLSS